MNSVIGGSNADSFIERRVAIERIGMIGSPNTIVGASLAVRESRSSRQYWLQFGAGYAGAGVFGAFGDPSTELGFSLEPV